jgi:hypothetical protein
MTPNEIQQLKKEAPALQEKIKANWQFLRQQCRALTVHPCQRCKQVALLLESPYALDLCIACLLLEAETPIPSEDRYYDSRSRWYDPVRVAEIPEGVWWS